MKKVWLGISFLFLWLAVMAQSASVGRERATVCGYITDAELRADIHHRHRPSTPDRPAAPHAGSEDIPCGRRNNQRITISVG